MTELAKHIAQQIVEYCGRGMPERLEEIIDSAGVRELTAELEAEIENRKGWQSRAADAEAKIYHSETPCGGESPDPPINLRERVRELTEALEKTLVIARQALVYFNTESGRAAMKELEKIEARTKGAAKETRLLGMNETELANIEHSERGATDAENGRKDLPSALTPYHGGENG